MDHLVNQQALGALPEQAAEQILLTEDRPTVTSAVFSEDQDTVMTAEGDEREFMSDGGESFDQDSEMPLSQETQDNNNASIDRNSEQDGDSVRNSEVRQDDIAMRKMEG